MTCNGYGECCTPGVDCICDGTETNADGGEWTADSNGDDGVLRLLALWSQTRLGFSAGDDMVIATTRNGINDNFEAGEDWLIEEFGER